ncbi:MAG: ABC transporter ATP-binding protein [Actinomycetota bacterium]
MSSPSLYRRGVRLLWRSVRTHPVPFGLSLAGTLLFAATAVLGTVVLGDVTDDVLVPSYEEGDVGAGTILAAAGILVAMSVGRTIGVMARRYYAGMTNARMQRTLREQLAERFVRMPLAEHRQQPTGRLLAHADSDVERATEVLNPLPFSLGVVALIGFSLIALALLDPWFLLIGAAVFPSLTIVNRIYTARVERPAVAVQEAMGSVATIAHESYGGALVVKTLGREAAEVERLEGAAEELRVARRRVGRLRARFEPTLDAIPNLGIVALVAVGSWRISDGAITTGDLVQAIALFQLLAFPMRVLGYLLEELPRSVVAQDRLDGLLATTTPDDPLIGDRSLSTGPIGVSARSVVFAYDDAEPVLRDVDLDLVAGEILAVVGSTGSGKSTLTQVLAGLEPAGSGEVLVGGIPVADLDPRERADALTVVFQESFLFADTLRENVLLGREVPDDEFAALLRVARVDRFLPDLPDGLDTVVGERGVTLSGGQRQRVALARGLVGGPRVLFLDDATSAIDPTIESEILDGLRTTLRATTLVVAQRRSTIALADRVAYLDGGRIVATGTHDELLEIDSYQALVRAYELAAARAGRP